MVEIQHLLQVKGLVFFCVRRLSLEKGMHILYVQSIMLRKCPVKSAMLVPAAQRSDVMIL